SAVLDAPARGCLNIHASLLPRWRGAAPVERAILAGDRVTGVTIMQMDAGLDTGDMLLTRQVEIAGKTAGELTGELAMVGAEACVAALADIEQIIHAPQPDEGVTYAAKIDKREAALDLTADAVDVERAIRAFNPAPGAWIDVDGERIKVLAATLIDGVDGIDAPAGTVLSGGRQIACGTNGIAPTLVQRPGKRPMGIDDLLNGFAFPARITSCPATD
ncbi:MAG: methionyl-tRNA formyltransferase, partial [Pseudomonadota bacterium]